MFGTARARHGIGLLLALAWTWPASAADCGDLAGPDDARVPCACGDLVVTDTTLEATDPIVADGCASDVAAGLDLVERSVTLDCAGLTIDGPGFDSECARDETCGAGILISASRVTVQRCTVTGVRFRDRHGGRRQPPADPGQHAARQRQGDPIGRAGQQESRDRQYGEQQYRVRHSVQERPGRQPHPRQHDDRQWPRRHPDQPGSQGQPHHPQLRQRQRLARRDPRRCPIVRQSDRGQLRAGRRVRHRLQRADDARTPSGTT